MKEKFKKVTVVVKEKWDGFSKAVKVCVCCIPVALIAIIIILALILNHKNMVTLYSGLTTAEAAEIAGIVTDMGIKDVKMTQRGEVIVPSDQVDNLRMQLAVQGYPKSSSDYSIWNDGVDLWSTDKDKREVARQQREARIESTLRKMDAIRDVQAILDIPNTRDYVITEKEEKPSCSVTLQLQDGEELTNAQVRAIFSMISNSVDGLTYDRISVVDTKTRSYRWISPEDEAADEKDASGTAVGYRRLAFQRDMEVGLKNSLDEHLTKMFGKNGYALTVTALLDYDAKKTTSTTYIPMDENGTGVLEHENNVETNTNLNNPNGLTGATPNADDSPDYPTYNGIMDGQTYYYSKNEKQYDVSNIKEVTERDGYKIEKLSVGIGINAATMTEAERESIALMVANAAGTDIANVGVHNRVFAIDNSGNGLNNGTGTGPNWVRTPDKNRNLLIILVIVLGVILIGLLIASLMMSNSRKKKIRKRQEQALAAAQAAAMSGDNYSDRPEMPQEVDFNIASLTEEAGRESRETILKREIAEFAKSSPDIVASIIRNMMREESD